MHDWQDLHAFWFAKIQPSASYVDERLPLWFERSESLDERARTEFSPLLEVFAAGELDRWKEEPSGWATLIVLLDQIPRNSFRGTEKMYAWDTYALNEALALIETGTDRALDPFERLFAYLPLEHSESLDMQVLSVELFGGLAAQAPAGAAKFFSSVKEYSQKHFDVIAKYGRFPHRNAILRRESTPEELVYLAEPGAGF